MKWFMVVLVPLLLGFSYQPASDPCYEAGSVVIDTITTETVFSPMEDASTKVIFDYTLGRSPGGQINYTVLVESIRFTGDPAVVDGTSTLELFDNIDRATVASGVALGFPPCPNACDQPATGSVKQVACVTRNGMGLSTRFNPCAGAGCCIRVYAVCCPNGIGSPVINFLRSEGPDCLGMAGCQSTCY